MQYDTQNRYQYTIFMMDELSTAADLEDSSLETSLHEAAMAKDHAHIWVVRCKLACSAGHSPCSSSISWIFVQVCILYYIYIVPSNDVD